MFSLRRLLIKLAHGLLLRLRQAHEANQAHAPAYQPAPAPAAPAAEKASAPAPRVAAEPPAPGKPALKPKKAAQRKPKTQAAVATRPAKKVMPAAKNAASKTGPGRLKNGAEHEGTVWIPRILWALAWAKSNQAEPASPADLARILKEQAGINVAATNTARAFRDLKKDGRGAGLWNGDKQYKISPQGEKVLAALVNQ